MLSYATLSELPRKWDLLNRFSFCVIAYAKWSRSRHLFSRIGFTQVPLRTRVCRLCYLYSAKVRAHNPFRGGGGPCTPCSSSLQCFQIRLELIKTALCQAHTILPSEPGKRGETHSCCEVIIWTKFGLFGGYYLGQVVILAYFYSGFKWFLHIQLSSVFLFTQVSGIFVKIAFLENCVPKLFLWNVLVLTVIFWTSLL